MEYNKGSKGILQRIDLLMEELQQIRREVADMLVRQAESASAPQQMGEASPTDEKKEITTISSLEELYSLDFEEKRDEPKSQKPASLTTPTDDSSRMDDLFVERGAEETMEQLFEARKGYDLIPNLTIADRYLFANELFYGDQEALKDMLEDIEHLSSWEQVESYLYDVRQIGRDEEVAKHLTDFIKEHHC